MGRHSLLYIPRQGLTGPAGMMYWFYADTNWLAF
jgi:hypothetical protein